MINWEIKLSANQIACLRAVAEYENRYIKFKAGSLTSDDLLSSRHISQWISGSRVLHVENLIWHESKCKKADGSFYNPNEWQFQGLTEKGRLVLQLIEMDVQQFGASIQRRTRKLLGGKKSRKLVTA